MYMSPLYAFLFYTALILGTIPLLLIWKNNTKFDKKNPIFPYVVVVFIASFYEYFGTYLLKINATNWFMVYKILAITTLQYYFYHILNKKHKALFIVFSALFIATFVYNLQHLNDKTFLDISAYLNAITTCLVITFSILWFKQLERKTIQIERKQNPNVYFIVGLLFMYGGTIILYLYANNLYLTNKELFFTSWMLNFFLNIVNRTLLIVGVWKIIKHHKNQ